MPFDSVSIAICSKDRAEHLKQTLASLSRVHPPQDLDVELVVVDNDSDDDTASVARQQDLPFRSRVLHEPRTGLSHARNRALAETEGDLILFTDDDVRFPKNWITGMTQPIRNGEADAVAGGVIIPSHLERPWMQPWHRSFLASSLRIESQEEPLTDMVGANMCFGRHVLSRVPRFDPNLGAGARGFCEESYFALQLTRAGFRIAPAFDVAVEHHFDPSRLSRDAFLSATRKLGRSMAYIHNTYLPERRMVSEGLLQPSVKLLSLYTKLFIKRLLHRPHRMDGGPPLRGWEKFYVLRIAYLKQSLRDRMGHSSVQDPPYDELDRPEGTKNRQTVSAPEGMHDGSSHPRRHA